ncbi:MAG: transcription antitermination factor NusB [Patescibacteria group bacterium]
MKSAQDPRHKKRIATVKQLFSSTFQKDNLSTDTLKVLAVSDKIDDQIQASAPQWPISKINKIDLAILRLAIYELNQKKTPEKVVIDEAVEIAKRYGAESTPGFVNGVLGAIVNSKKYEE